MMNLHKKQLKIFETSADEISFQNVFTVGTEEHLLPKA